MNRFIFLFLIALFTQQLGFSCEEKNKKEQAVTTSGSSDEVETTQTDNLEN